MKLFAWIAASCACLLLSAALFAQTFPERPVKVTVPFTAGSSTHSANPGLYTKLSYDALKASAHISPLVQIPTIAQRHRSLNSEIFKFLKQPDTRARLQGMGIDVLPNTPELAPTSSRPSWASGAGASRTPTIPCKK